jgi:hypothetical protein
MTFTPKHEDDAPAFFNQPNCTEAEHEKIVAFLLERGVTVFSPPSVLDDFKIHQEVSQDEGNKLVAVYESCVNRKSRLKI